jgi:toxin CcdB
MAQFDVHANPNPATRDAVPYVLDVQGNYLAGFTTRVVVPLARVENVAKSTRRLNPTLRIDGADFVMMAEHLAAVQRGSLGRPVASLDGRRDDIIAAIDVLIVGV